MSDKDTLISMGFPEDRVAWALKATQNRGLQPSMDFILEHNDDPVPDLSSVPASGGSGGGASSGMDVDDDDEDAAAIRAAMGKASANVTPSSSNAEAAAGGGGEARSIKCSECGKIFKNVDLANFHAEKSGHDQFEESTEEIKPLTEEEKKQKLEELRAKMAAKRAVKAAEDARENQANELIRRKAGKDQAVAREELKVKQALKEQEAKRREKIEEAKAKAAIKAQIEADKVARAQKAAKEKALREGKEWTDAGAVDKPGASTSAPAASTSSGVKGADYKDTRLQIRAAGGTITLTLPSDQTLGDAAQAAAAQNPSIDPNTVSFTMNFPRKTFARADFTKSLRELGLTPSAALQAS
ncbi:hypothetical protein DL93DRAFT_2077943 [Clavulina sp. PMI_390]|nr:hypothetical protein DL93DRAFT_2077943 [Clavulina sp. PMI_390]